MKQSGKVKTFEEIVGLAEQNRWCVQLYCSTCRSHRFREELRKLSEEYGGSIANVLCASNLDDLRMFTNWDDAVHVALNEINEASDMDKVLKTWIQGLNSNIMLADLILYYFVRRGAIFAPMSTAVLKEWTDECKKLAVNSKNESLLESLIFTLGKEIYDDQELMETIKTASKDSVKIQRALQKSVY